MGYLVTSIVLGFVVFIAGSFVTLWPVDTRKKKALWMCAFFLVGGVSATIQFFQGREDVTSRTKQGGDIEIIKTTVTNLANLGAISDVNTTADFINVANVS